VVRMYLRGLCEKSERRRWRSERAGE